MARAARIGSVLISCASAAALAAACAAPPKPAPPADSRKAIVMPAESRAMILGEMRTMLGALSQFLSAASAHDTVMMRTAATTAGLKAAVDVMPAVQDLLPEEFRQIGAGTHVAFDSLARSVSQGASQDVLLGELAGIMGRCVSCHSAYRLELTP